MSAGQLKNRKRHSFNKQSYIVRARGHSNGLERNSKHAENASCDK